MTAAVVTVAGCTDDTPSDPPASGSGSEQEEIDTSTPGGPTPEELSEQVLTAPRDGEDTPAIGTATGTLAGEEPLTVDVLAVRRLEDATCPYFPMEVGPEPQVLTAVYPALPAGTTTVDLRLNDTDVVVTGLPVS